MTVVKCPICKGTLVGFAWTKTPKGKNWLKKGDKWHDCPNKKLSKKTAGKSSKVFGFSISPASWDSEEAGYYCTNGHFIGAFEGKDQHCHKCGTTTAATWLWNGGPRT
jgi:hypothetical protein